MLENFLANCSFMPLKVSCGASQVLPKVTSSKAVSCFLLAFTSADTASIFLSCLDCAESSSSSEQDTTEKDIRAASAAIIINLNCFMSLIVFKRVNTMWFFSFSVQIVPSMRRKRFFLPCLFRSSVHGRSFHNNSVYCQCLH